jgi:hypothetical protein
VSARDVGGKRRIDSDGNGGQPTLVQGKRLGAGNGSDDAALRRNGKCDGCGNGVGHDEVQV